MILIEDVEEVLSQVLHPDAHNEWWLTPIDRYAGKTPFDIWHTDGPHEVMRLVKSYLEPGFS